MQKYTKYVKIRKNHPRHLYKFLLGSRGVPWGSWASREAFIARKRSPRLQESSYRGPDARFWQENIKKKQTTRQI